MRILILDSSIAFTGAFKCSLSEAEILSDKHTFVFVLPKQSVLKPNLDEKGIKVHFLPMIEIQKSIPSILRYFPRLIANAYRLRRILNNENIDVLQVNDFYNLLGVMVRLLGFKGMIITYVRFLPNSRPAPLRKIWSFLGRHFSKKMIAVSDIALQQLPAAKNTIRIYDPVQLAERLPPKQYSAHDVISILYQGNYIRGKGQDAALEAFALAYAKDDRLRLNFAGGDMGMDKNRLFKEELQNRVKHLSLQNVVTFSPFLQKVEEGIKKADIVLNFSESESFSMTCLEASFYGTSLIATRCGGPEEIIVDGETGLLVPLHDYQSMADAICKLAANTDLRNGMAKAARQHVLDRFPVWRFREEFEGVLNEN